MVELVLFDIDGTLLDCHRCQERAFANMFRRVFNIPGQLGDVAFPGMLTLDIIRAVCAHHNVWITADDPRLEAALALLPTAVRECMQAQALRCVLPGVIPLLEAVRQRGTPMGVYTGNPQAVGEVLLKGTHLYSYFRSFAYGDEADTRKHLLELSLVRAAAMLPNPLEAGHVAVFGDSIHDLQAARALGMMAITVATGPTRKEHLRQQEPDHLLDDLRDIDAVLRLLQSIN